MSSADDAGPNRERGDSGQDTGDSGRERGDSGQERGDSGRETLERMLDSLVYAPLGLLLEPAKPSEELAAKGRQHVEAARLLGRMALGHSSASPAAHTDSERPSDPKTG